jgi:hypothetical protein
MTITTEKGLKEVVEKEVRLALKAPLEVTSATGPHKHGKEIYGHESMCLAESRGTTVRAQHFYGFKDQKPYVLVSVATPFAERNKDEISALEGLLRTSGVKYERITAKHAQFQLAPEERELEKTLKAYFRAEKKVWQATRDYQKRLAELKPAR